MQGLHGYLHCTFVINDYQNLDILLATIAYNKNDISESVEQKSGFDVSLLLFFFLNCFFLCVSSIISVFRCF